ncbi:MAG: extracellular solute-binding protein [Chloroflexi bacterium]|nr:extracellular solute-binding protein [Chloroflexota bacterium]
MSDRLNRRRLLGLAATTGVGALLAACGQAPTPTPAPAPKPAAAPTAAPAPKPAAPTPAPAVQPKPAAGAVSLRLVAWADIQDKTVYDNMAAAIGKANPKISVAVEQYPGQYYEKVQTNFAGNSAADVIYFQGWKFQPFIEAKVLSPLDDLIKRDNLGKGWPDNPNYKNNTTWHGETIMSPTDVGSLVIYFNKDLFTKRGIPHPKNGWKWEDFKKAVQGIAHEDGGVKYYSWMTTVYGRATVFMRMNGAMEWDRPVEPTKAQWTHPDIVDAFQFALYDAIANGLSPSPSVIQGGGVSVGSGRVGMVLDGPWHLPQLWGPKAAKQGGINFEVVEPPLGTSGYNQNFAHIHGHTISKQSKIRDESWEVMKFILSDEGQKIIAEGGRMCGTPDNIDKIWAPIATKNYNFTNAAAYVNGMKQGATPIIAGAGLPIDAYGGANNPVVTLQDQMRSQKKQAKEALEEANPAIQKLLDEYWKTRK